MFQPRLFQSYTTISCFNDYYFKGVFIKSNVLVIYFSVPLKDRGQFRSVWCHVVWDVVDSISQIMVSNEEKAEIYLYKKKLNNLY